MMWFIGLQLLSCIIYSISTGKSTTRVERTPFYDNYLFFTTLIFVHWLRYKMIRYYMHLETTIDPNIAEFSVALSNLPMDMQLFRMEEELRDLFEGLNHYNGISYHVQEVVFFFDTSDYIKLLNQQEDWKNRLVQHNEKDTSLDLTDDRIEKNRERRDKRDFLLQMIETLENQILEIEKDFKDSVMDGKTAKRFTGKGVVVFKTQVAAHDLLEKYDVKNPLLYRALVALVLFVRNCCCDSSSGPMSRLMRPLISGDHFIDENHIVVHRQTRRLNLFFREQRLFVIKAVNPNNIIWKNFGYSYYQKYFFRISFFSFSLMILAFSFGLVRKINDYRFEYFRFKQIYGWSKFALNGLISLTILTFNSVLNQFILHTIQFEWHEKRTNELSSQLNKIILKMFLNTTVMIFLLCFNEGFFDAGFLVYQILMLNSITAFLSPLVGFWDFSYFLKKFRRFLLKNQTKIKETQTYLNGMFENPEYNIVLNYSGFIFHFLNLICYSNFFPFWVFFLILIYFIFNFYLQKQLFIRRNSVINEFRNELNNTVLNIIDFSPFLMLSAQYFRSLAFFQENTDTGFFWVKMLLAVWTLSFPNERLLDYFFLKRKRNFGDYEKYREIFRNWNYTKNNPGYMALRRARYNLNN